MIHVDFHEFCEMFPDAAQEEFNGLVEDIKLNGLLEPIMLFEGKILDGRTRYKACVAADVPPTFMPFTGDRDEAYCYVVSKNLHRRHLTNVQRAFLVAKIKNDPRAKTVKDRFKLAQVPRQTQEHVEKVMNHLPEFTGAMVQGDVAPHMLLPLQKNPERRKQAKALLDAGQIKQLMTLLSGKEYRAFTGYRDTNLSIKRAQAIPSIDKVIKLMDVALGFLQRFYQIKEVLEELVRAEITIRQRELLKTPLDAIKSVVPVQREELRTLSAQLIPETAKAKLIEFYEGVFEEMKRQVTRRITNKSVQTKPPIVIEENERGLAASGKSTLRPKRPRAGAYRMGYDLSDLSDGADVEVAVARMFEQYDKIMQSIVKAVDVLSNIPDNQVDAAIASENPPENADQGVTVIPLAKPALAKIQNDPKYDDTGIHWSRVKEYAETVRSSNGAE